MKLAINFAGWDISLVGSDISETMIAAARKGIFPNRSLDQTSDERRSRYFSQLPDEDRMDNSSSADQLCANFNGTTYSLLMPGEKFDCIFIRNVFIYFDRESKQVAVQNLIHSLAPGGALVVGPADGIYDLLGELNKKTTFPVRKTLLSSSSHSRRPSREHHQS